MTNIVEQKFEIYELLTVDDSIRHVERCGRNCYKSEALITNDSSEKFIRNILKSGHESVIEHAHFIFKIKQEDAILLFNKIGYENLAQLRGLNITKENDYYIVSGNPRTFRDIYRLSNIYVFLDEIPELFSEFLEDDKNKLIKNKVIDNYELIGVQRSEYGDKHNYYTFRFDTSISTYKDITRHRNLSFSIESSRFCNYSKKNENGEHNIVDCSYFMSSKENQLYLNQMQQIQDKYNSLANNFNSKPDVLRMILSHGTAASVVMSGSEYDLKKMLKLRTDSHAHPTVQHDMKEIEKLLNKENKQEVLFLDRRLV